jgi:hypothetical protein
VRSRITHDSLRLGYLSCHQQKAVLEQTANETTPR